MIWEVEGGAGKDVSGYQTEPAYTVRLGDRYVFTPPISQHDYVRGRRRALFGPDISARDAARRAADENDETFCYIDKCFISDEEKARFIAAFDEVAAAGGDMVVSGVGPRGPVNIRYSLAGLDHVVQRMEQCSLPSARAGRLPDQSAPQTQKRRGA